MDELTQKTQSADRFQINSRDSKRTQQHHVNSSLYKAVKFNEAAENEIITGKGTTERFNMH